MKKLLFLPILLFSKDWFITQYEYGKMLYNNPRGISCSRCHGSDAKGKIITTFYSTKKEKFITIKAPNIQKVDLKTLKKALFHSFSKKERKKLKFLNIMPKYDYLTEKEIEAIYLFLKGQK